MRKSSGADSTSRPSHQGSRPNTALVPHTHHLYPPPPPANLSGYHYTFFSEVPVVPIDPFAQQVPHLSPVDVTENLWDLLPQGLENSHEATPQQGGDWQEWHRHSLEAPEQPLPQAPFSGPPAAFAHSGMPLQTRWPLATNAQQALTILQLNPHIEISSEVCSALFKLSQCSGPDQLSWPLMCLSCQHLVEVLNQISKGVGAAAAGELALHALICYSRCNWDFEFEVRTKIIDALTHISHSPSGIPFERGLVQEQPSALVQAYEDLVSRFQHPQPNPTRPVAVLPPLERQRRARQSKVASPAVVAINQPASLPGAGCQTKPPMLAAVAQLSNDKQNKAQSALSRCTTYPQALHVMLLASSSLTNEAPWYRVRITSWPALLQRLAILNEPCARLLSCMLLINCFQAVAERTAVDYFELIAKLLPRDRWPTTLAPFKMLCLRGARYYLPKVREGLNNNGRRATKKPDPRTVAAVKTIEEVLKIYDQETGDGLQVDETTLKATPWPSGT